MKQREAYTLLEVLLAMAIAIMLLGAVYSAIGYQIRHAQAGRDLIDQTTLVRSILDRITADVAAVASLPDPGRYRNQQQQSASGAGGAGMGGAGASGAGGTGAAAQGAAGGATGASGTASGASSSTGAPGAAVTLPKGVVGNASELHLFVGRFPGEAWPTQSGDQAPLTSDLRRIRYWIDSEGKGGLCRQEIKVVTSADALNFSAPTDNTGQYLMAPEVHSLEFSYFDGTNWTDNWDSTMTGPDNVTPVGSPRAIAITIGVPAPGDKGPDPKLKTYRQVVLIRTANGPTYVSNGQVNQGGLTTTGASTATNTGPGSATP